MDLVAVRRRTTTTLFLTQALGGAGFVAGFTAAGVLAADLKAGALAGLPASSAVVGQAVGSLVLSEYMSKVGRRRGLIVGYVVAMAGAAMCAVAAGSRQLGLLLLGMLLFGWASASNNISRYAAGDVVGAAQRGRTVSLVVWGSTLGVTLGPNLLVPAGAAAARFGLARLAGPFVFAIAAVAVATLVLSVRLRPDPLDVAKLIADAEPPVAGFTGGSLARNRRVQVALASMLAGYVVMVTVMVMTPVHMREHHQSLAAIGGVISGHVFGMYALSPVTGWACDQLGRLPVIATGAVVLAIATSLTALGTDTTLPVALFLLGAGWNMCFVGGSTLLTDAVPVAIRARVQGRADLAVGLTSATGSASAGVIFGNFGFGALSAIGFALAALLLVGTALRRPAPALAA